MLRSMAIRSGVVAAVLPAGLLAWTPGLEAQSFERFFPARDLTTVGVYYYPEQWDPSQWDREFANMAAMPPPTRIGPTGNSSATGSECTQPEDIVLPGAVGDDREMVWTHVAFGDSLAARGDLAAAEALFRRAIAAQPDNARAYAGLAGVFLRQGHREEAITAAREARRLGHPGDHWVFRELGL